MIPVFAKIKFTRGPYTVATLSIFGREIEHSFDGEGHAEHARDWVQGWNEHLTREWDHVRGTTSAIVTELGKALIEQGVSENDINIAMKRVYIHAKG